MISLLSIFAAFLALGYAQEGFNPYVRPCEEDYLQNCTVYDVRYNPCGSGEYCTLIRGEDARVTFNFIPHFSADKLSFGMFWIQPTGQYVEITNNDSAYTCGITSCPTRAGSSQTLSHGQQVLPVFAKGLYNVKVKVWNEEDEDQVCCFRTTVMLADH